MSDYVAEEIQIEILKWLPVRSLLRFRSVCQWWKQLIDSPSFQQQHLAVQKPRFILEYPDPIPQLIVDQYSDEDEDEDPDLKPKGFEPKFIDVDLRSLPLFDTLHRPHFIKPEDLHLLGTLHGIVCLYYYYMRAIYLWNPWIRQVSKVPFPLLMEVHDVDWQIDPDTDASGTHSAFWIDPLTKDFKIIIFKLVYDEDDARDAVLYSSTGGDWKLMPMGEEVQNCKPSIECPAIVMGGVAHWRSCYDIMNEEGEEVGMDVVVLSFDFHQERFEVSKAPSVYYLIDDYHPQLCEWQGSLSLAYVNQEGRCDLYARQEGVWVNVLGFDVPNSIERAVWVDPGERGECSRVIGTTEDELVVWDTKEGCIPLAPIACNYFTGVFMACHFVESLLFVDE